MENCIGIDVSKASINVHISKSSQDLQLENSLRGFKILRSKLKKIYKKELDEIIFIFEPTGSYSEGLRKYCSQQQIICFIINPKQFSNYAKALGEDVKNDIVDARVLSQALHIAKEGQVIVPVFDEDVERIKELMRYYKFTTKQTTQQKNHLESLTSKEGDPFAIRELKRSIKASKEKESGTDNYRYKRQIQKRLREHYLYYGYWADRGYLSFTPVLKIPRSEPKTDHIFDRTEPGL